MRNRSCALNAEPAPRHEIHTFLRRLATEEGVGIVISAAPSDSPDRLVDNVMMLSGGTVLHCGPAAALKQQLNVETLEDAFNELHNAQKLARRRHA